MQKQNSKQISKIQSKQYKEVKSNMSKRVLALVLAIALVFSTFTVAFADETVSEDAKALAAIKMLIGDGNGVTVEYVETVPSRLQSAILFLRLKGLENDAKVFEEADNFKDAQDYTWAEGKNIMAYLKAHPELGWIGSEGNFMPGKEINEQSYYKVLLEALGYNQNTSDIVGDFEFSEVFEFAKSIGLNPKEDNDSFTIDDLARSTVEALKHDTKDGKILIEVLIEAGKIDAQVAIDNGLYEEVIAANVKSAKAIGNSVIEVVFEEEVDARFAENAANFEIAGLDVKEAKLVAEDTVRLGTTAMTAGKLYTLSVNDAAVKFTGIAKIAGAPGIQKVESKDIEEIEITFNKTLDFETATNAANYAIADIEIEKAELDGDVVTLTTSGLEARKQYTIKVTNVESVDGGLLRSETKSFYTRPDLTAPTVSDVKAETNKRVIVTFNKNVNKETAENLENYVIKTGDTELAVLDAKLIAKDNDKELEVELTTEEQKASARYDITIDNIADQTKSANVMKKAVTKNFYGKREDTTAPALSRADIKVLSRNHIQIGFTDASRLDEVTVLDANNYTVTKNGLDKADVIVEKVEKISYEDGKYIAILTVEDLEINSSYTVKADNIEDEFGNVLEKNNSATVSVSRDGLAASTVSAVDPVNGNKVKITFTKPLDKASAEDIGNYTINGSIGTPVKASYKNEVVTLETIKMTTGKEYEVKVKGVEDLAGNILDLKFKFTATEGEEDTTAPKLVSIYAVDKYTVAALFDEEVDFETGTKLVLVKEDKTKVELIAKAKAEDGRVVEFSGYPSVELTEDVYTVAIDESFKTSEEVVGIKDKAVVPNYLDVEGISEEYLIYGNSIDVEAPEVLSVYQKDGKSFEMIMSKDVVAKTSETSEFKVKVDKDDKTLVTFTLKSGRIIDGHEYKTNISLILEDFHGVSAVNVDSDEETILFGEYKDEDKPYIVDVIAIDRYHVEIEFNEALSEHGVYEIKNLDGSATYKTISYDVDNFEVGDKKVVLKLKLPLESRYDYQLIVRTKVKDLVGNDGEDVAGDEFFFIGTDLAPVELES